MLVLLFALEWALIAASLIQTRFERNVNLLRWEKLKSILEQYDMELLDPSYEDDLALRTATLHDRDDVVRMLLQDSRVNPFPTLAQPVSALDTAFIIGNPKVIRAFIEDGRVPGNYISYEGLPQFTNIPEGLMIASSSFSEDSLDFDFSQLKAIDFELLLKRSRRNKAKRRIILGWFFSRIGFEPTFSKNLIGILTDSSLCEVRKIFGVSMRALYLYRIFSKLPADIVNRIVAFVIDDQDGVQLPSQLSSNKFAKMLLAMLFGVFILALINPLYYLERLQFS